MTAVNIMREHITLLQGLNDKGYTDADIAREIGVSAQTIYNWKQKDAILEERVESLRTLFQKERVQAPRSLSKNERETLLKEFTMEELIKEIASRSFKVTVEWMGGF